MGGLALNEVENRLAKKAKLGNRHAFAELIAMYQSKIYQLCYRMLGNRQEAEDAVQETFLRVHLNLNRYHNDYKFSTWIFRIATNYCIDRLRQRKQVYSLDAKLQDDESDDHYSIIAQEKDSPENQVIFNETQKSVHKAIDSLPSKYKTLIILRYIHDLSLQELCDILNLPMTTVKVRLHRGREYLRKKIQVHKN